MKPKDTANSPSRRTVLGGMGAGLVAAAAVPGASPASAQQAGGAAAPPQAANQNLLTQYPNPPFREQRQEPPGLASKMDPRPDHGETSCRGAGKLAGRKALVTGGDSGIGRAAAIAFAREGADVAINYLPVEEPDARKVVQLIQAEGRKAVAIPGDIRDEAFCNQLVARAVEGLGGLDILVNTAATQTAQQSILDVTTEQFYATFKTNIYAMFWITKAALPHLSEGATIINTSPIQAYESSANLLDYAQTKACIVAFTKALSKHLSKQLVQKGIRVNAVAPGPFWTPLQPSGGQPPEKIKTFSADSPFGRPGQLTELASTYVLLASQESRL